MTKFTIFLCSIATLVATPVHSWAQDNNNTDNTAYAGISGALFPEYLGSADQDFRVLPYLSVDNFKGFDIFGPQITYRLIDTGTGEGLGKWSLQLGPRIAYQIGRDPDDSPNLANFDDISGSLPVGAYLRSTFGPVGFRVDAGQDVIGGHDGFTLDASVGTFYSNGFFNIQPSLTLSLADGQHNETFFGVSDPQAAVSPFSSYEIGSGAYAYSANVVSWLEFDNDYAVALVGSYRNFIGNAADSPILLAEDGSRDNISVALSFVRKFNLSKF